MKSSILVIVACAGMLCWDSPGRAEPPVGVAGDATIQLAAFGDPSSGGHHHGKKTQDAAAPAKPEPPQEHSQPETVDQHNAYLKRYGFGQ